MWAAYTPTTTYRAIDNSPHTQALDKAFATAAWDLLREQVDFDYIDQKILCECELKDGKLYYRDRVWSAVVLPAVDVLEDTAAEKLLSAAASGVSLLFCDQLPQLSRESGAPSAFAEQFQALVADQAAHFAPTDGFAALLDQQLALYPADFFRQFRNEAGERGLLVLLVEDMRRSFRWKTSISTSQATSMRSHLPII